MSVEDLSAEFWVPDEAQRAEILKWLGERPEAIQVAIKQCPPWVPCWKMKDTSGHYRLISYSEGDLEGAENPVPVTMLLVHLEDSWGFNQLDPMTGKRGTLSVFGVRPDNLVACGCQGVGPWEKTDGN